VSKKHAIGEPGEWIPANKVKEVSIYDWDYYGQHQNQYSYLPFGSHFLATQSWLYENFYITSPISICVGQCRKHPKGTIMTFIQDSLT